MAYATFADVQARAGRYAGFFTAAGKHPDQGDIEGIIADLAAEVDASILARGFDPTLISEAGQESLRDLVAYGALARGLTAAGTAGQAADLLAVARGIWDQGAAGLLDGRSAILLELEGGRGGQKPPGAGSFWGDEATYPTDGDFALAGLNPLQAPMWAKGQRI